MQSRRGSHAACVKSVLVTNVDHETHTLEQAVGSLRPQIIWVHYANVASIMPTAASRRPLLHCREVVRTVGPSAQACCSLHRESALTRLALRVARHRALRRAP